MNAYGPTECSDDVTHYPISTPPAAEASSVPIGRAVANIQLYILDAHQQLTPIGVVGELYVGGIGVGRGYLNDTERTDVAFVPNPFASHAQARVYKTGDLVRYRPDGNIEFLGRTDHQIKLRGFRIELGEIESLLDHHPEVHEALVQARTGPHGQPQLVAYVVGSRGPEGVETQTPSPPLHTFISELKSYLREKLPDYMVPTAFIMLDRLPLTPNGKIDTRALPEPDSPTGVTTAEFLPLQTPTEERLAAMWAEVLTQEQVGRTANFFELGGHSLLATQVIARVRETFGVEVSVRSLFESPTLCELARQVDARVLARHATASSTSLERTEQDEEEGEI